MNNDDSDPGKMTFETLEAELRAEGLLPEPKERACSGCGTRGLNHDDYDGENIKGWYCNDCWHEADCAEYAIEDGRMTKKEWTESVDRKRSDRLLRD